MKYRFGLAVILSLLPSACAGRLDGGSGPQLVGRMFGSTEVTGRTLVADTRIQLAFPESGKLTALAGCNRLFGDVTFDGDHLRIAELGSTEMGCDAARHEQDEWLAGFLSAGPTYALNGSELVLTSGAEVITLVDRDVAEPDRPLLGTRWVVESLLDGQSASSVPAGATAFLQFDGDLVSGSSDGCDRVSGTAIHRPGSVAFSDLVTTGTGCAAEYTALRAAVLATLRGEVTVKIDSDQLTLHNANAKGLQLRAQQP